MTQGRRRILWFCLGFAPLFAFFLWLYPKILPRYERIVLAVANPCLARSLPPLRIDADSHGDLEAFAIETSGESQPLFSDKYAPHTIYLSLVFLPALILATPVSMKRRFQNLLLGLSLLFALHVLTMVVLLKSLLCLEADSTNFACFWIHGVALTSGQVAGFVVWALLSWTLWFPKSPGGLPIPEHMRIGRNVDCPCGSGRKYKFCCGR